MLNNIAPHSAKLLEHERSLSCSPIEMFQFYISLVRDNILKIDWRDGFELNYTSRPSDRCTRCTTYWTATATGPT